MAATPIPRNEAAFTVDEIVAATGAEVVRAPARALAGVVTDSRATEPGNLFVALRGEVHDAHDYVAAAAERGAHALLVEREVDAPEGVGVLRVEDTLDALGALAGHHRGRMDVPVVAITGSVGKTSTKELVAAALLGAGRHPVWTRGNLNNRIGVPMTLLTLDAEHDAAVIEIGMSVPGEIAALAAIVRPSVGLVTAIEAVHTEGVGSVDGVRREKGALLAALGRDATAIWRDRDPEMEGYAASAGTRLRFGATDAADVRLQRWELDGHGATTVGIELPGRDALLEIGLPLLGEAAALNATAAIAALHALAPESVDDAAEALAGVPHVPHRLVPVELDDGPLVIDDSYNASPASTTAALETAAALAGARGGALIAVLGDMLELGRDEERMHADVGREVVRVGAVSFVACGERMTHAGRAALGASMEGPGGRTKVVLLRNVDDAAACVRDVARPEDVVLVKGSRGMRMERVVEALRGGGTP